MKIAPVPLPRGFRFSASACGIKKNKKLDLGLITCEAPASAAAVFTKNRLVAAPVIVSQAHLHASHGRMRAVVVNSGNANCATGAAGLRVSKETTEAVARIVGCATHEVFVCSTGVIGVPLPVHKIISALPDLAGSQRASRESFTGFARAIMTTDLQPKWAGASCRIGGKTVRIAGCAKGSGMIHPNMATLLGFLTTDVVVAPALLHRALSEVIGRTFNAISVDGDTSTNDTVLIMASGASGAGAFQADSTGYRTFLAVLEKVCRSLAIGIVADGEGAQRVIEILVRGARREADARSIAQTIATSPLVKTAFAGGDPNWGRILAAAGRAGVAFDPARAHIIMAGIPVYRAGHPLDFDERAANKKLIAKHVPIVLDLRAGRASARYWTCDFTAEYVRINASYRT